MLASSSPRHYFHAESIQTHAEMRSQIKWTSIKPSTRAIAKVFPDLELCKLSELEHSSDVQALHHYSGDIGKLNDITRETIVFSNISDITRCLHTLMIDPDIVLSRCRNSMVIVAQ